MYILGVNISHDPSVCLLKDGEIMYYSEDERLTGDKFRYTNDIQRLTTSFYEKGEILPIFNQIRAIKKYTTNLDYIIFTSYGTHSIGLNDEFEVDRVIIRSIITKLTEENINFNTSVFYENNHHIYHAANSFYASGFDDAVALVMDGGGSFDHEYYLKHTKKKYEFPFREVESIYNCSYDFPNFNPIFKTNAILDDLEDDDDEEHIFWKRSENDVYTRSHSCGNLFCILSGILDINSEDSNGPGKVMGLSGHRLKSEEKKINDYIINNYESKHEIFLKSWYETIDGVSVTSRGLLPKIESFVYQNVEDVTLSKNNIDFYLLASLSYKLQKESFFHTCGLIQKAIKMTGKNKIVLSGGYFMNCVNNYKYTKAFPNVDFFVDPISHDGGTAIGAAKFFWYGLTKSKQKFPFENLYFGPEV